MDTDKKQGVDANGANGREFGHKECKDHKMKDVHAAGLAEVKNAPFILWFYPSGPLQ
jgi:hypothetical protein